MYTIFVIVCFIFLIKSLANKLYFFIHYSINVSISKTYYDSRGAVFCRKSCVDAIEACVREFGLPDSSDKLAEELLPYVFSDKKRRADSISLIVPRQIGQCDVMAVGADDIVNWLKGTLKHESHN